MNVQRPASWFGLLSVLLLVMGGRAAAQTPGEGRVPVLRAEDQVIEPFTGPVVDSDDLPDHVGPTVMDKLLALSDQGYNIVITPDGRPLENELPGPTIYMSAAQYIAEYESLLDPVSYLPMDAVPEWRPDLAEESYHVAFDGPQALPMAVMEPETSGFEDAGAPAASEALEIAANIAPVGSLLGALPAAAALPGVPDDLSNVPVAGSIVDDLESKSALIIAVPKPPYVTFPVACQDTPALPVVAFPKLALLATSVDVEAYYNMLWGMMIPGWTDDGSAATSASCTPDYGCTNCPPYSLYSTADSWHWEVSLLPAGDSKHRPSGGCNYSKSNTGAQRFRTAFGDNVIVNCIVSSTCTWNAASISDDASKILDELTRDVTGSTTCMSAVRAQANDVVVGWTDNMNHNGIAWSNLPGGQFFVVATQATDGGFDWDEDEIVQHELSHLFDAPDRGTYGWQGSGIMNYYDAWNGKTFWETKDFQIVSHNILGCAGACTE